MKNIYHLRKLLLVVFSVAIGLISCEQEDDSLAPYVGSREISELTIEKESFNPKVTWVGGYISTFGVNRGSQAALDSTLVWLIHTNGDKIIFPVTVGQLPEGAQDITVSYGGVSIDSLEEDELYTVWIMKETVWQEVSSMSQVELTEDTIPGSSVTVSGDSLLIIGSSSFEKSGFPVNVYINILNVRSLGPLADLFVDATPDNIPRIRWTKKAAGVTDTMIAAIGFVRGVTYDASGAMWEVYSERDSAGIKLYARDNLIKGPVVMGDSLPGTREFIEFTTEALVRNEDYHIWIADKTWDRENRQRFTPGYSYITFRIE